MTEPGFVVIVLIVCSVVEGGNGIAFALRGRRTLSSAGLSYHDDPGLLIQEFGVYSIAIALTYLLAVFNPVWRPGLLIAGIAINVAAACMHLIRSAGLYFGDTIPRSRKEAPSTAASAHGRWRSSRPGRQAGASRPSRSGPPAWVPGRPPPVSVRF